MKDELSQLHKETYDTVADEYEERVETLRSITEGALKPFAELLPDGSKILDIGCAVGYTAEILHNEGMIVDGIDIAPKMIEYARRRNPTSNFRVGDFLEESYPHHHYDGILMYAFMHLFPKDIALESLDKAIAITKPGGLIFNGTTKSNTASEGFEVKRDYQNEVKRYRKHWTKEEMDSVFESRGLEVVLYTEIEDEFGKIWMDYIIRTPLV